MTAGDPARRGWLRTPRPVPGASVRLVCLPHAGGTAGTYRPWLAAAPADVELTLVQYPGREDRIREAPWTDVVAMATAVADLLADEARPLVLFGHSLGGTIAYEVARRLPRPPRRLVVSARIAPMVPPSRVFHGSDDDLLAQLHRLGGTAAAVLAHPELRDAILPAFRGDLAAADGYVHDPDPVLRSPLHLFLGADDPAVARPDAERWREVAPTFALRVFPGGHFYLQDRPTEILRAVLAP